MVTTARNFVSGQVLFSTEFPSGAEGTSLVKHLGASRNEVIVNWPAFTYTELPSSLSWEGSFVSANLRGGSQGPAGGPTVFYDSRDASLSTVVVGSVWGGNWKSSSAGNGTTWNGTAAWAPGIAGTITSLPKGYTQHTVLHAGPGITGTLSKWGELMQQSRPSKGKKINDITLNKIGYQTDNGAMYCFCQGNCTEKLINELASLNSLGTPMGYLSFQGAGASSGRGQAAPWCVDTWGVDGGLGGQYPDFFSKQVQSAIGVPLQLYAPYFCPGSNYFNNTNWTSIKSDTSLQGCRDYAFENVSPGQSRAFYDWFFAKGENVGMVSFEPDFMNQNYNCMPEFIESTTAAHQWQHGMAEAAQAKGISVQWCYATPTDVLAALDMPSVTNFRVSFDFCYGGSFNIGTSGMLVWALGAHPSKDTLWTTTNNHTAIPGCSWTRDHEAPAAELHVMLALMSTGHHDFICHKY